MRAKRAAKCAPFELKMRLNATLKKIVRIARKLAVLG